MNNNLNYLLNYFIHCLKEKISQDKELLKKYQWCFIIYGHSHVKEFNDLYKKVVTGIIRVLTSVNILVFSDRNIPNKINNLSSEMKNKLQVMRRIAVKVDDAVKLMNVDEKHHINLAVVVMTNIIEKLEVALKRPTESPPVVLKELAMLARSMRKQGKEIRILCLEQRQSKNTYIKEKIIKARNKKRDRRENPRDGKNQDNNFQTVYCLSTEEGEINDNYMQYQGLMKFLYFLKNDVKKLSFDITSLDISIFYRDFIKFFLQECLIKDSPENMSLKELYAQFERMTAERNLAIAGKSSINNTVPTVQFDTVELLCARRQNVPIDPRTKIIFLDKNPWKLTALSLVRKAIMNAQSGIHSIKYLRKYFKLVNFCGLPVDLSHPDECMALYNRSQTFKHYWNLPYDKDESIIFLHHALAGKVRALAKKTMYVIVLVPFSTKENNNLRNFFEPDNLGRIVSRLSTLDNTQLRFIYCIKGNNDLPYVSQKLQAELREIKLEQSGTEYQKRYQYFQNIAYTIFSKKLRQIINSLESRANEIIDSLIKYYLLCKNSFYEGSHTSSLKLKLFRNNINNAPSVFTDLLIDEIQRKDSLNKQDEKLLYESKINIEKKNLDNDDQAKKQLFRVIYQVLYASQCMFENVVDNSKKLEGCDVHQSSHTVIKLLKAHPKNSELENLLYQIISQSYAIRCKSATEKLNTKDNIAIRIIKEPNYIDYFLHTKHHLFSNTVIFEPESKEKKEISSSSVNHKTYYLSEEKMTAIEFINYNNVLACRIFNGNNEIIKYRIDNIFQPIIKIQQTNLKPDNRSSTANFICRLSNHVLLISVDERKSNVSIDYYFLISFGSKFFLLPFLKQSSVWDITSTEQGISLRGVNNQIHYILENNKLHLQQTSSKKVTTISSPLTHNLKFKLPFIQNQNNNHQRILEQSEYSRFKDQLVHIVEKQTDQGKFFFTIEHSNNKNYVNKYRVIENSVKEQDSLRLPISNILSLNLTLIKNRLQVYVISKHSDKLLLLQLEIDTDLPSLTVKKRVENELLKIDSGKLDSIVTDCLTRNDNILILINTMNNHICEHELYSLSPTKNIKKLVIKNKSSASLLRTNNPLYHALYWDTSIAILNTDTHKIINIINIDGKIRELRCYINRNIIYLFLSFGDITEIFSYNLIRNPRYAERALSHHIIDSQPNIIKRKPMISVKSKSAKTKPILQTRKLEVKNIDSKSYYDKFLSIYLSLIIQKIRALISSIKTEIKLDDVVFIASHNPYENDTILKVKRAMRRIIHELGLRINNNITSISEDSCIIIVENNLRELFGVENRTKKIPKILSTIAENSSITPIVCATVLYNQETYIGLTRTPLYSTIQGYSHQKNILDFLTNYFENEVYTRIEIDKYHGFYKTLYDTINALLNKIILRKVKKASSELKFYIKIVKDHMNMASSLIRYRDYLQKQLFYTENDTTRIIDTLASKYPTKNIVDVKIITSNIKDSRSIEKIVHDGYHHLTTRQAWLDYLDFTNRLVLIKDYKNQQSSPCNLFDVLAQNSIIYDPNKEFSRILSYVSKPEFNFFDFNKLMCNQKIFIIDKALLITIFIDLTYVTQLTENWAKIFSPKFILKLIGHKIKDNNQCINENHFIRLIICVSSRKIIEQAQQYKSCRKVKVFECRKNINSKTISTLSAIFSGPFKTNMNNTVHEKKTMQVIVSHIGNSYSCLKNIKLSKRRYTEFLTEYMSLCFFIFKKFGKPTTLFLNKFIDIHSRHNFIQSINKMTTEEDIYKGMMALLVNYVAQLIGYVHHISACWFPQLSILCKAELGRHNIQPSKMIQAGLTATTIIVPTDKEANICKCVVLNYDEKSLETFSYYVGSSPYVNNLSLKNLSIKTYDELVKTFKSIFYTINCQPEDNRAPLPISTLAHLNLYTNNVSLLYFSVDNLVEILKQTVQYAENVHKIPMTSSDNRYVRSVIFNFFQFAINLSLSPQHNLVQMLHIFTEITSKMNSEHKGVIDNTNFQNNLEVDLRVPVTETFIYKISHNNINFLIVAHMSGLVSFYLISDGLYKLLYRDNPFQTPPLDILIYNSEIFDSIDNYYHFKLKHSKFILIFNNVILYLRLGFTEDHICKTITVKSIIPNNQYKNSFFHSRRLFSQTSQMIYAKNSENPIIYLNTNDCISITPDKTIKKILPNLPSYMLIKHMIPLNNQDVFFLIRCDDYLSLIDKIPVQKYLFILQKHKQMEQSYHPTLITDFFLKSFIYTTSFSGHHYFAALELSATETFLNIYKIKINENAYQKSCIMKWDTKEYNIIHIGFDGEMLRLTTLSSCNILAQHDISPTKIADPKEHKPSFSYTVPTAKLCDLSANPSIGHNTRVRNTIEFLSNNSAKDILTIRNYIILISLKLNLEKGHLTKILEIMAFNHSKLGKTPLIKSERLKGNVINFVRTLRLNKSDYFAVYTKYQLLLYKLFSFSREISLVFKYTFSNPVQSCTFTLNSNEVKILALQAQNLILTLISLNLSNYTYKAFSQFTVPPDKEIRISQHVQNCKNLVAPSGNTLHFLLKSCDTKELNSDRQPTFKP